MIRRKMININERLRSSLLKKACECNETSGCIFFTGCKNPKGYGQLSAGRMRILAHRASYYLFKGDIPKDKLVLHRCDRPWCINPDHLFLGSPAENTADMMKKKRYWKGGKSVGEQNPTSKVKEHDVRCIKILLSAGKTAPEILKILNIPNITKYLIYDIKRKRTWKHITL